MNDVLLHFGDGVAFARRLTPGTVHAIVTDPPYGMNWDTDTTRFSGGKQKVSRGKDWKRKINGDNKPFDPSPWLAYNKVIMWGYNHFADKVPLGTLLVWVKRNDAAYGSFLSDAEIAWMKGGEGIYCFRDVPNIKDKGDHPTQKTVDLMVWCMDRAKIPEGATVFDPYMGSGTTGVACMRTGRNFIGCETDSEFFDIAKEKIEYAQLQPRISLPVNQFKNFVDTPFEF